MKLIIKLPKRKADEVAKAEERKHQNALATTSQAALEGLDLASKVKSRKRKSRASRSNRWRSERSSRPGRRPQRSRRR